MATTSSAPPDRVAKFLVPGIVFGHGAPSKAGFAARRVDARRVFVVTDPGIILAGWLQELQAHLADAGLPYDVWHGVTPNPKDHEVAAGFQVYQASGADVIIGLGGESVAQVPNISITDPRLLVTMPEWLNAATGLDALMHGIEAYVSQVSLEAGLGFTNAAANPARYVPIAPALGVPVDQLSTTEAADAAADRVRALADSVGVPMGLADLGVTLEDIPHVSTNTLGDACLTTNPRDPSVDEVSDIFRAAL